MSNPLKNNPGINKLMSILGLEKDDLEKSSNFDVVLHKMALVGMMETIKTFADAMKTIVMTSPGRPSQLMLKMYLNSILAAMTLTEKMINDLEVLWNSPSAETKKEEVPGPDPITESDSIAAKDHEDFLQTLLKGYTKKKPSGNNDPSDGSN